MPLREHKYLFNQSYVYIIGCKENDFKIKIVTMKTVRNPNIECDDDLPCNHYEEKLQESISRTRSKIYDLALCNPWDYFFTGTVSPDKYNRFDLSKIYKDFSNMIRNFNSYHNANIKYLIIPEKHKDGAWHFHGLLSGVPDSELSQFVIGDRMSKEIAEEVKKGESVFDWKRYSNKFGFCDLEKIKNREAVIKYITKYITKDLQETVTTLNAHMYYRSLNLSEPLKIKEGLMSCTDIKPTYESDYCVVTEIAYTKESLDKILNSFV